MARTLQQLLDNGETEETIQSALDGLKKMISRRPKDVEWQNKTRQELTEELNVLRAQGALF